MILKVGMVVMVTVGDGAGSDGAKSDNINGVGGGAGSGGCGGEEEVTKTRGEARTKVQGAIHRTTPRTKEKRRRTRRGWPRVSDRGELRRGPQSRKHHGALPALDAVAGGLPYRVLDVQVSRFICIHI